MKPLDLELLPRLPAFSCLKIGNDMAFCSRLLRFSSPALQGVRAAPALLGAKQPSFTLVASRTFSGDAAAAQVGELPPAVARDFCEVDNDSLVELSLTGNVEACEERLIREIMAVDEIEWEAAKAKFEEIDAANSSGMFASTVPYKVGIAGVTVIAFATVPLCFDLNTALVFNDNYVTTELAETKDLETWLEVGAWTWNWMEPPLGQLSFFLLCLQFSRAQMEKIGSKPFTHSLIARRARKLSSQFGEYRKDILEDYSTSKGLR